MQKKYFTENKEQVKNVVSNETYKKDEEALFKNSSPRCPVVLVVDTSGSMRGEKINEVNRGVKKFIEYINEDYLCKKRVELALVSFGDEPIVVSDFTPAETKEYVPFTAGHNTYMAPALKLVLDMISARKKEYKEHGRGYFRPLVLFMTDGGPSDEKEFLEMKAKIYDESVNKHLCFFAIKIGTERSEKQETRHSQLLQGFDQKIPAGRLDVDKFGEFFNWLSASVTQISSSSDTNTLNIADPNSWWKELAS